MSAKPTHAKPTWCVICEQRPAEGTLRRTYLDDGSYVNHNPVQPTVCQVCAEKHHHSQGKSESRRVTLWEFELFPEEDTARRAR